MEVLPCFDSLLTLINARSKYLLIMSVLKTSPVGRPKRLFTFVNPFGGKKCAKKIYDAEIKPLFEAAGVSITVQGSACKCGWFSMNFTKYFSMVFVVTSIRSVRDLFQRPSTGDMPGRWRLPSTLPSTTALSALAATVSSWRLVT